LILFITEKNKKQPMQCFVEDYLEECSLQSFKKHYGLLTKPEGKRLLKKMQERVKVLS
jgi:hypothetical protein